METMNFFTSDSHFFHRKILSYCSRPFPDVEAMDQELVERWNAKVGKADTVFHLGDFCFGRGSKAQMIEHARFYRSCLNGQIHFIYGNHDKAARLAQEKYKIFESVSNLSEININGQDIVLCHYAMRTWRKSHRGSWHLYGHSHGNLPDDPNSLSFDVGVDCHNFAPISFDEVSEIMKKKAVYHP